MIAVLSFFFVFGIKITAAQRSVVQTCPKTKAAWDQRSSMFTCVNNTRYHCVMDSTWTLVEICVTSLSIPRNIGGCPTVYIFDSKSFWLFPFTPCPIQNNECPQESHGNYTSEQLFKYPACFLKKDEREMKSTGFQQSTAGTRVSKSNAHREEYRQDVAYIPYAFGTTLILIVFILVLLFVQKRHTQNLFKKALTQGLSSGNSVISIVSAKNFEDIKENEYTNLPIPDYGTETRSNNSFEAGESTSPNNCDIKENEYAHLQVPHYRTETRSSNSFGVGGFTSRQNNSGLRGRELTVFSITDNENDDRSTSSSQDDGSLKIRHDLRGSEFTIFSITDNGNDNRSASSSQDDGSVNAVIRHDLRGSEFTIFSIIDNGNDNRSASSQDDGSVNALIRHGST